jgi:hypothetical protein
MKQLILGLCLVANFAIAGLPDECRAGDRYTFQKEMDGELVTFYAICTWNAEESRYTWYISNIDPDYSGND